MNHSLMSNFYYLPADDGKGPHATSSSGLPPLSLNKTMVSHSVHTKNLTKKPNIFSYLDRPVVSPDLGCRESTRGASLLLDMERNLKSDLVDS